MDEFRKIIDKCHDLLWEGGKRDPLTALNEFNLLLLLKLHDELQTKPKTPYLFQLETNTEGYNLSQVKEVLFSSIKQQYPKLFDKPPQISDKILTQIVELLQPYSLRQTDLDVKGQTYEIFLSKIYREQGGQYFTPRTVVNFMVDFMNPQINDIIFDPACGSGGFLIATITYLLKKQNLKTKNKLNKDIDNMLVLSNFIHKHIYGMEINEFTARTALLNLLLYSTPPINIFCDNSLTSFQKTTSLMALPNKISLILTNPPFGGVVRDANDLKAYQLGHERETQKTEILFIEFCLKILHKNGKIGMVLPDSILTNSSLQYVRDYIIQHARILSIISLPSHAFNLTGASVKASLVFLQKLEKIPHDYPILMINCQHIGYDALGNPDSNDLDRILQQQGNNPSLSGYLTIGKVVPCSQIQKNFSPAQFDQTNEKEDRGENTNNGSKKLDDLTQGNIFPGKTLPRSKYSTEGIKILKVRDLTGKGIDWDNAERGFVDKNFFDKYQSIQLQVGDILFISSAHHKRYIGEKIDIIDSIPERFNKGVLCTGEILVVRVDPQQIDPYYVWFFLRSPQGFNAIQSCIRGQTAHIYSKDIKQIRIPILSKAKMQLFMKQIDDFKQCALKKTAITEFYVEQLNQLRFFD